MPNSGSGQGTPIVIPASSDIVFSEYLRYDNLAFPLAYYPKMIGYDECAFWGVLTNENQSNSSCSELWTETDRAQLFAGLYEAQQRIEDVVGYFLMPTFVAGTLNDAVPQAERFVDQATYESTIFTRWAQLIEFGKRTESWISVNAITDYSSDPVVFGPFAVTLRDIYEVKIYHPESNREITPSKIIYANGNLTIHIPKCRLVREDLLFIGTKENGVAYEDDNFFEESVDIKRVYADNSYQANLISSHDCNYFCASNFCSEHTQSGCVYIRDSKLGFVHASPGNYNSETSSWRYAAGNSCSCNYANIRLYYRSGLKYLTPQLNSAIVRLAHTLIPDELCDCIQVENNWKIDREVPRGLSRAKQNNPFGEMNGAWAAWRSIQRLRTFRAGIVQ